MDIVKSAIFSALGSVKGARVLDLFAGTGSLGIEALSRGAASATFIEKDSVAVDAIRQNLAKTRFTGEILAMDVFSFLDRRQGTGEFDFIIADPPYAKKPGERDFGSELLASPAIPAALSPHGVFVLEHLPDVKLTIRPPWICTRDKRYGATAVAFLMLPQ
jgi:16S rRNA (guanine966-N2)-methyltransferase